MSKSENSIGIKYGRLLVIGLIKAPYKTTMAVCICECGKLKAISLPKILNGNTNSCGCFRVDKLRKLRTTHGHSLRNRTYKTWVSIKNRCTNPNNDDFKHYGGRGITVCDKWITFEGFLDEMGEKPIGMEIDRINNDGPYCKSNCRWATRKEQVWNRRNTAMIQYNGSRVPLVDVAKKLGINYHTLFQRINRYGWSDLDAVSVPVKTNK